MANLTVLEQQSFVDFCVFNSTPSCSGKVLHLFSLGMTCVSGMTANGLLAVAIIQQQKNRGTRDGVLILNLVLSNVVSLLVNLPLQSMIISNLELLFRCEQTVAVFEKLHFLFHFACNFSTLFTLAVIAIERFDAITKLPGQSEITRKGCVVSVVCGWVASAALSSFLKFGPFRKDCVPLCIRFLSKPTDKNKTVNSSITVILVTIWITTCCTITCSKLIFTARKIKNHQQQIEEMFGQRKAKTEIRFTKICFVISFTFILLWAPYGIAFIIASVLKDIASSCAVYWTQSLSHTSSALVPIVYIALDKRILGYYRPLFRKNQVQPAQSMHISTTS